MATKVVRETGGTMHHPIEGFDVTATIGHVSFSDVGDMTPMEAAMRLIGRHAAEAVYTFPHENGGYVHVHVEIDHPEVGGNGRSEYDD